MNLKRSLLGIELPQIIPDIYKKKKQDVEISHEASERDQAGTGKIVNACLSRFRLAGSRAGSEL